MLPLFFAHFLFGSPAFSSIVIRPSDQSEEEDLYLYTVINMVVPVRLGDFPRGAIENLSIRRTSTPRAGTYHMALDNLCEHFGVRSSFTIRRTIMPPPSHFEFGLDQVRYG